MTLTDEQVSQLLQPIHPSRVLADGKGHAHVSQQDVLAHLIRVFGFGNFDTDVLSVEPIFEQPAAKNAQRFDVCYRALVRLTIRDSAGKEVAHYENGSTATAQNQTRGDAHDLAMKSAISLAVKRAAIALGDQFGLSLYNKGQREALVRGTLVGTPKPNTKASTDLQEGIPQQVAMGHDEADIPLDSDTAPEAERTYQRKTAPPPDDDAGPEPGITKEQLRTLQTLASKLDMSRETRLAGLSQIAGREITTANDLLFTEASAAIKSLAEMVRASETVTDELPVA